MDSKQFYKYRKKMTRDNLQCKQIGTERPDYQIYTLEITNGQ
jgi:hypothetical protein